MADNALGAPKGKTYPIYDGYRYNPYGNPGLPYATTLAIPLSGAQNGSQLYLPDNEFLKEAYIVGYFVQSANGPAPTYQAGPVNGTIHATPNQAYFNIVRRNVTTHQNILLQQFYVNPLMSRRLIMPHKISLVNQSYIQVADISNIPGPIANNFFIYMTVYYLDGSQVANVKNLVNLAVD